MWLYSLWKLVCRELSARKYDLKFGFKALKNPFVQIFRAIQTIGHIILSDTPLKLLPSGETVPEIKIDDLAYSGVFQEKSQ